MSKIKIIIADDHELIRDCLVNLFSAESEIEILGLANNGLVATQLARELSPDIILMDIDMPKLDGIEATKRVLADSTGIKVIAVTACTHESSIDSLLNAGCRGYIPKKLSFSNLIIAIKAVHSGSNYLCGVVDDDVFEDRLTVARKNCLIPELTKREKEVACLVANGLSSKLIATTLCVSTNTVIRHRHNIMDKLDLNNTADLTRYAIRERLISIF